MRLKPVSRDRSCLNRSVRICNDENLLPGSWPPPNFLELRKSLKVHTQTSARIPPPGATLCIFHMFNVGCHSIRWGMTIDETGPGSARVCLDHGALPPSHLVRSPNVQRTLEGLNSKQGRWASFREPLPLRPKVMQNPHSAGNACIFVPNAGHETIVI